MNGVLTAKVERTITLIRQVHSRMGSAYPFIAFSTGKDRLAMTAMIYEAIAPKRLPCVYVHHDLEFPVNLDYLGMLKETGFDIDVVHPYLNYFELAGRGIGFLTLTDPWCVPMLVGTGLLDWLCLLASARGAGDSGSCETAISVGVDCHTEFANLAGSQRNTLSPCVADG